MLFDELFDPSPSEQTPIACDLSVLDDPEEHKRRFEALFEEREALREVSGGVVLRFSGTMEYADRLVDFISRERQCCPFLSFGVAIEPEERGVWLYMGGDEDVEEYITQEVEAAWERGEKDLDDYVPASE